MWFSLTGDTKGLRGHAAVDVALVFFCGAIVTCFEGLRCTHLLVQCNNLTSKRLLHLRVVSNSFRRNFVQSQQNYRKGLTGHPVGDVVLVYSYGAFVTCSVGALYSSSGPMPQFNTLP